MLQPIWEPIYEFMKRLMHMRNNGIWVAINAKIPLPQNSMRAGEQKLTFILEWPNDKGLPIPGYTLNLWLS